MRTKLLVIAAILATALATPVARAASSPSTPPGHTVSYEGVDGSTMLRYGSEPSVRVLSGAVESSYDAATGDLRLDYTHAGLARVLVTGGGRRPLLLLLGTDEAAADFWRVDTRTGPALVRGTALVRSAETSRRGLALRADTAEPGAVEVFAPARRLVVNGRPVRAQPTPSGSLVGRLPGPRDVELPGLVGWRTRVEAPEAEPGFDDPGWTVADHTTPPTTRSRGRDSIGSARGTCDWR